jgi:hypothetical protein
MTKQTETIEGLNDAVEFYRSEAKTKSSGILEVPKAAFVKAIAKHGVTEADLKRVNDAVNFETTAAAALAVSVVEEKISQATKDQLKDEDFRIALDGVVRIPTFGGATTVTAFAETHNPIPQRGNADGNGEREIKVTYGRIKTQVATKSRIIGNYGETARDAIRAKLDIKD